MMDSVLIGTMKMTHLQANCGKIPCHVAQPLSPIGVSHFLSSRVTKIVIFESFPKENGREGSQWGPSNLLKSWIKLYFLDNFSGNGIGIAL